MYQRGIHELADIKYRILHLLTLFLIAVHLYLLVMFRIPFEISTHNAQ